MGLGARKDFKMQLEQTDRNYKIRGRGQSVRSQRDDQRSCYDVTVFSDPANCRPEIQLNVKPGTTIVIWLQIFYNSAILIINLMERIYHASLSDLLFFIQFKNLISFCLSSLT